jgi:hypothetical protein
MIPDPTDYLSQDLLALVLDPGGEVTTSGVVVSGHLDQAAGFPRVDPGRLCRSGNEKGGVRESE